MRRHLLDTPKTELVTWCQDAGERPFRAGQIWHWISAQRATDFEQMTNLPKAFRQRLAEEWVIFSTSIARSSLDQDGTDKLLLALADGQTIECVLLPEEDRRTICISTQVGCGMGCVFCASGLGGVERNLTTGEIIEEMLRMRNLLPAEERLSHIVVMGMGEPMANLENLLPALDFATSKEGLGISARHVTISTVGLPAKIHRLAEIERPYHLAVSLHAPNDDLRRQIVPTAEKVLLADILAAADAFRQKTGRQVTFEYVLLADINDRLEHARELARLLGRRDALINLIPYNPVSGLPYETPAVDRTNQFAGILREAGFVVKIRKRKGSKISAACGQLRRSTGPLTVINP
jgi:23S rRNA (adenine2503-C2)-methyltransferase